MFEFYEQLAQLVTANNVRLAEKEHFVLEAHSHVLQGVIALESFKVKENMGLYDATLSLSCELLNETARRLQYIRGYYHADHISGHGKVERGVAFLRRRN